MRIVKSDAGVGFPLRMDDLRYMTQGLTEALAATTAALGQLPSENHGILLRGTLNISGNTAHISDALIYFNNEIFFIPQQSVVAVNPAYPGWAFSVQETVEATRTFKDGISRPVHVNRVMSMFSFSGLEEPPSGTLNRQNLINLQNVYVLRSVTGWATVTLGAGSAHVAGNSVSWRINSLGNLEVRGAFTTSTSATTTLFTLPVGSRPPRNMRVTLFGTTGMYELPENPMHVTFNASGSVEISNYSGISDGPYAFNHTIIY